MRGTIKKCICGDVCHACLRCTMLAKHLSLLKGYINHGDYAQLGALLERSKISFEQDLAQEIARYRTGESGTALPLFY